MCVRGGGAGEASSPARFPSALTFRMDTWGPATNRLPGPPTAMQAPPPSPPEKENGGEVGTTTCRALRASDGGGGEGLSRGRTRTSIVALQCNV